MPREEGWFGVDLDGTLARYDSYLGPGEIGEPIRPMVQKVRAWLDKGADVRIFTARAEEADPVEMRRIEDWCRKVFGKALPITNRKDKDMIVLYDDRARQVIRNTGEIVKA